MTAFQRILRGAIGMAMVAAGFALTGCSNYPDVDNDVPDTVNLPAATTPAAGADQAEVGFSGTEFNHTLELNHGVTFYQDTQSLMGVISDAPNGVLTDGSFTLLFGPARKQRLYLASFNMQFTQPNWRLRLYGDYHMLRHVVNVDQPGLGGTNGFGFGMSAQFPVYGRVFAVNYQLGMQRFNNSVKRYVRDAKGQADWYLDQYSNTDISASLTASNVFHDGPNQFKIYAGYRAMLSKQSPVSEDSKNGTVVNVFQQYSALQNIIAGVGYRYLPDYFPGLKVEVNYNIAYRLAQPAWLVGITDDNTDPARVFKPEPDVTYWQHQVNVGADLDWKNWHFGSYLSALGYVEWTYGLSLSAGVSF